MQHLVHFVIFVTSFNLQFNLMWLVLFVLFTTLVNLSVESFTKEIEDLERDWYKFGFALGIPVKTLEEIEDKNGMRRYMLAMLNEWLGTGEATWEQLQVALVRTGNVRLSASLEKYIREQEQQQQG